MHHTSHCTEPQSFYRGKPVRALTGNEELNAEDLNRDVLSRLLDAITDFGPERFF